MGDQQQRQPQPKEYTIGSFGSYEHQQQQQQHHQQQDNEQKQQQQQQQHHQQTDIEWDGEDSYARVTSVRSQDDDIDSDNNDSTIDQIKIQITVHAGYNLIAKDRNVMGQRTTSDPFVRITYRNRLYGTTPIQTKTLNPIWDDNETTYLIQLSSEQISTIFKKLSNTETGSSILSSSIGSASASVVSSSSSSSTTLSTSTTSSSSAASILLSIWDHDKITEHDPMGVLTLPIAMILESATTIKKQSSSSSSSSSSLPRKSLLTPPPPNTSSLSTSFDEQETITNQQQEQKDPQPQPTIIKRKYPVEKGYGKYYCHNATGELEVSYSAIIYTVPKRRLTKRNLFYQPIRTFYGNRTNSFDPTTSLQFVLSKKATTFDTSTTKVDATLFDFSCVAINRSSGEILVHDTVTIDHTSNTNESVQLRSTSTTTTGTNELINISIPSLDNIPNDVFAYYFILSIRHPDKYFNKDIISGQYQIDIRDDFSNDSIYTIPILDEDNYNNDNDEDQQPIPGRVTSIFVARLSRKEDDISRDATGLVLQEPYLASTPPAPVRSLTTTTTAMVTPNNLINENDEDDDETTKKFGTHILSSTTLSAINNNKNPQSIGYRSEYTIGTTPTYTSASTFKSYGSIPNSLTASTTVTSTTRGIVLDEDPSSISAWQLDRMVHCYHESARNYGMLLPELKRYTQDIIEHAYVDPDEKIAVLQQPKDYIRIKDYHRTESSSTTTSNVESSDVTTTLIPTTTAKSIRTTPDDAISLSIQWKNKIDRTIPQVDLYTSVLVFDTALQLLDTIYYKHIQSSDRTIIYSTERQKKKKSYQYYLHEEHEQDRNNDSTTPVASDIEIYQIALRDIDPSTVGYICCRVQSFIGNSIRDMITSITCSIYDSHTKKDIAMSTINFLTISIPPSTDTRDIVLNGLEHEQRNDPTPSDYSTATTALVLGCFYHPLAKSNNILTENDWYYCTLSDPTDGRFVHDNVSTVQGILRTQLPTTNPSA